MFFKTNNISSLKFEALTGTHKAIVVRPGKAVIRDAHMESDLNCYLAALIQLTDLEVSLTRTDDAIIFMVDHKEVLRFVRSRFFSNFTCKVETTKYVYMGKPTFLGQLIDFVFFDRLPATVAA